ncbi:MAG TPA: hypothetical protein VHH73_16640 [Verrucomicrobiae bacterium]|nr:hypothetical protein [Verrucomicrobiae bacterium]
MTIAVAGLAIVVVGLLLLTSSPTPPVALNLISTELSKDRFWLVAKFSLTNAGTRSWRFVDSSFPGDLWQVKVKAGEVWTNGIMYTSWVQTASWRLEKTLRPGESQLVAIALPADGVERIAGVFLQPGGFRGSKTARAIGDWCDRAFHHRPSGLGTISVWSTNVLSHRGMLEQGLLATNDMARIPFDATRWRHCGVSEKIAMAKDLLAGRQLLGKTKTEVLALLGSDPNFQGSTELWVLGFEAPVPLAFPMTKYLQVSVDTNGLVSGVNLTGGY